MAYYEELNPIMTKIVGEKFLQNDRICRLLYYYPDTNNRNFDPFSSTLPNVPDVLNNIYFQHLFPTPKIFDAETKAEAYMTVVVSGGYEPEVNSGYRNVNLLIDIASHINCWCIADGYRVYTLMSEVDKMLNNQLTDLPIANKPYLRGFQPRDYSQYFYGVQMIYTLSVNSNVGCSEINLDSQLPSFLPKNLRIKND